MNIKQGLPCHNSNYSAKRGGNPIKYVVIHYTANNGDTAQNNCKYFNSPNRKASAHYFVGRDGVFQSVQDIHTAWHCGGSSYKHKYCRNANSIGIEMCSKIDGNGKYYIENSVIDNAIDLTKYLMDKYNIPSNNVIRHYDVTGKACPEPFVRDENIWKNFKLQLEGDTMTNEERTKFNELVNAVSAVTSDVDELKKPKMIYNYIDNNMPEWARPTIQKLVDKGILQGDENGLGLTDDLLRVLVINDRAGLYD
jgi:N-acetylmuramoyl-L-alanine amidase